jgi:hypothetical protein
MYTNSRKIYQHFPFYGPPKFTQIWIFGVKTNHLATLVHLRMNADRPKRPKINNIVLPSADMAGYG